MGPFGTTVEGPWPGGSPYEDMPVGQPRPGTWGALKAWHAWQHMLGTVLPQAVADLTSLPGL